VKPPKHKGPSFSEFVADRKKQPAVTEDADSWRERRPSWALSRCDLDGCTWSWKQVTGDDMLQIVRRLREYETRPWKEILQDKSNGSIEVTHDNIAAEAKQRLIDQKLEQYDTIWKLRIEKSARVWGVRVGATFHILWWDPEHTVYPMNLADN
jgi:hypothetical protein